MVRVLKRWWNFWRLSKLVSNKYGILCKKERKAGEREVERGRERGRRGRERGRERELMII